MQPAREEVVQNLILPASAATRERLARRQDVVALVPALAARVAEVVHVLRRADDREDDRVRARWGLRVDRIACGGGGGQADRDRRGEQGEEEKCSSGCRPVA